MTVIYALFVPQSVFITSTKECLLDLLTLKVLGHTMALIQFNYSKNAAAKSNMAEMRHRKIWQNYTILNPQMLFLNTSVNIFSSYQYIPLSIAKNIVNFRCGQKIYEQYWVGGGAVHTMALRIVLRCFLRYIVWNTNNKDIK